MEFATTDLRERLLAELRQAVAAEIAVAYFNPDPMVLTVLRSVRKLRLLVSNDFQINNPDSLEVLHRARKWVRAVYPELHCGNLHTKVYVVDTALLRGTRGLPGGDSLAKLLARGRNVRNKSGLPSLTVEEIRAWAEAHKTRIGTWPKVKSGPIPEAPGETWSGVNAALSVGMRGLPGGASLARLLARECGRRNIADVPALTMGKIRKWVLSHRRATGQWPKYTSGAIAGVPGETWGAVDNALHKGRRGLPGGSSVAKVVREYQGA